jgi:HK97 family phage major capsid protein
MKTLIQLQNERAQIESRNNQFATKIKNNEALTADELTEMRGLTAKLDALEQDIADAKAADEIVKRAAAAEFEKSNVQRMNKPASDEEKLQKSFSTVRALQMQAEKIPYAGAEREAHEEGMRIARNCGIHTSGGVMIPDMVQRSDFATALDAGNLGKTQTLPTVDGYRQKLFVEEVGATMHTGLVGISKLPIADMTAVAGFVAENGNFGAIAANVRAKTLEPKAILAKTTSGWYLQAQAGAEADRILRMTLDRARVNAINANVIKSIGAAAPVGIYDDTDVTDVTSANGQAISRALLLTMLNSAASNNAEGTTPVWVTSPTMRAKLMNLAVDAGSGLFEWDNNSLDMFKGYKAHVTTFAPINLTKNSGSNLQALILGYWKELHMATWGVRELIVDKASSDLGTVVKEVSFVDWAIANPKAFVKGYFTA